MSAERIARNKRYKLKDNKISPEAKIVRIACVMMGISVIFVCLGVAKAEAVSSKIALFCAAGLLFFLGALFALAAGYSVYARNHKHNFFLYDKKMRKDIPVSELTFEIIRKKVVDYMSLFKRGKKLYVGELFSDNSPLNNEAMKPLFCYELLYQLAETKDAFAIKMFLGYGDECSRIFSKYLYENGDYELSSKIVYFFTQSKTSPSAEKDFADYVSSHKAHIEKQVVEYTKNNIDRFVI